MKKGESKEKNEFTPEQLSLISNIVKKQTILEVNESYKTKTAYKTTEEYELPGIYLLKFEDGIKVGMSINVKRRISNYNKPWCKDILDKVIFYTNEYQILENEILKKTKYNRTSIGSNEWVTDFTLEELTREVEALVTEVNPHNY